MPFLVWDSPHGRAVYSLDRALVVIGRDAGSDLLLDDPTVSRRHVLVQSEGGVKVTDLRSTGGTRINGAKLKPDVPCTLEPGDFLQVGKVVLSFHVAAPPPGPPSPVRRARARTDLSWKPFAIGVAFVAVAAMGGLLAFMGGKEPPPPAAVVKQPEPAPPTPEPEETPPVEAPALAPVVPVPKEPEAPARAAAGELPPREAAPDLPDLIEVDRKTYHPVRVRSLGDVIEALGADGRLYAIPADRVTKIEDRADLARRAGVERRRLAPGDVAARVALAEWCAARLLVDEAKALVREALSLEPDDPASRALKERLG